MALVFDGPVPLDALTTFVREVPYPANMVLNRILPDQTVRRPFIDIQSRTFTHRTARYRAYDARLHVSRRDSMSTQRVQLPPLGTSLSMGEYERIQVEFSSFGGTNDNALRDAIYDDAGILTGEVLARMEQARGDVLTDGKFTLTGEGGLFLEADFGVPAGHFVAPGTLWSTTATATIINNMISWSDTYLATNGFRPGSFVTSTRVLNYMLQNAEFRTLLAVNTGTPTPGLITRQSLDAILTGYGLPPLQFVYDSQVDVDGVTTKLIPDDRVIFLPPNVQDLGYTAWGVSATSLELVNSNAVDLSFEQAPGIVGVVVKEGPPFRQFTFVDAVGMPVLNNPKLLMVADVA